jgi:hypothetical protein
MNSGRGRQHSRPRLPQTHQIDAEPVLFQFVKAHVAEKGHTFTNEIVWVIGNCTAVSVTFVPDSRVAEATTYLGKQNLQALPQSIAEGVWFESHRSSRSPVYKES